MAVSLGGACPASAHGFGQRYDLPVPLFLWMTGAGAAVFLSFVAMGMSRAPFAAHGYPRTNLLRWTPARLLVDGRLTAVPKAISVILLVVIVVAGLLGTQTPTRNLAPTAIWVVWWVGLAYVSALIGNVWVIFNPWSVVFGCVERMCRRRRTDALLGFDYPGVLGAWPAVGLFAAFAWAELVFAGRAVPAQLALMAVAYSLLTWLGMSMFGRDVWLRYGEAFTVVFGLLARFAPTEIRVVNRAVCRDCDRACLENGDCVNCASCFARARASERELSLRPFAAGLFGGERLSSSMLVFVLLVLSTVTFDGLTATPAWATVQNSLYAALPALGAARLTLIDTFGLIAVPALFALVYWVVASGMARGARTPSATWPLARVFVLSLVPIAIAYHLAHYFTYVLIQGQLIIPLVSDPFGFGWNLFGTARYRPDIGLVGARFAWYTAVIAIVGGHIIAVYVAHVIALRNFRDRAVALRSQLSMLALMVGYTVVSLWIIAQPIVETGTGA